ncbi:MAG: STAS domain-containing protein [Deltaproteobacteria bacterium]|nr:STAS domain-containing protein [Deltaproteobacteria bacterium]MBW1738661.1 STAS domain-containing protein [Deltaproteobacteria bacterium]MBW1909825.1 STAS domain-containing protein [Deltaproteobacteria bacterium]MBW2035532.1 STAS domain-containing protein [Deltaproteobacteria bacterium]MBW2114114.1 STAS domain-containing protein [Deltaproteobacteria bacterium]
MEIIDGGKTKNTVIVAVKGRMDAVSAPEFEKRLGDWIEGGEIRFIIDFCDLDYISSAGLRSILTTAKKLKAKDGQIFLAALKEAVKEVFEISGFSSIIPIYDSVEAALSQA